MLLAAFALASFFRRPVSELNISWTEFCHWQTYLKQNPPEQGDNERFAALMATITNMSGRQLASGKRVTAGDFLPKQEQSAEQQIAFMRGFDGS